MLFKKRDVDLLLVLGSSCFSGSCLHTFFSCNNNSYLLFSAHLHYKFSMDSIYQPELPSSPVLTPGSGSKQPGALPSTGVKSSLRAETWPRRNRQLVKSGVSAGTLDVHLYLLIWALYRPFVHLLHSSWSSIPHWTCSSWTPESLASVFHRLRMDLRRCFRYKFQIFRTNVISAAFL